VARDGTVIGVVFSDALDDQETGFVLTVDQVSHFVQAASGLRTEVNTGNCAARAAQQLPVGRRA
jgi:hypothetical protein